MGRENRVFVPCGHLMLLRKFQRFCLPPQKKNQSVIRQFKHMIYQEPKGKERKERGEGEKHNHGNEEHN